MHLCLELVLGVCSGRQFQVKARLRTLQTAWRFSPSGSCHVVAFWLEGLGGILGHVLIAETALGAPCSPWQLPSGGYGRIYERVRKAGAGFQRSQALSLDPCNFQEAGLGALKSLLSLVMDSFLY